MLEVKLVCVDSEGLVKVGREVAGEWRSLWDGRLPRTSWLDPEDSVSREDRLERETYCGSGSIGLMNWSERWEIRGPPGRAGCSG